MDAEILSKNFQQIQDRIDSVSSSTNQTKPELLAVSKFQSIEKIHALNNLGQVWFGENYAQELVTKASDPRLVGVKWQFIGSLQSNKINKLVEHSDMISSISSIKHARLINNQAIKLKKTSFPVAILVNTASEASKSGVMWSELEELVNYCREKTNLNLRGVMVIPPRDDSHLGGLSRLDYYRHIIKKAHSLNLFYISIGMSNDLDTAIEAGTSQVRIGTAIFGIRPKQK